MVNGERSEPEPEPGPGRTRVRAPSRVNRRARGGFHGLSRIGVRTRLVGFALLPIVGISVFAWEAALPKLRAAERSGEVRSAAGRVGGLTQVRYLVSGERILSLALATVDGLGLDDQQATALFGRDLREELATSRAALDERVAGLPPIPALDEPLASLAGVRKRFDAGLSSPAEVVAAFEHAEHSLQRAMEDEAVALDHAVASLASAGEMHDASSSLPLVADALDAGLSQVVALGLRLLLPGEGGREYDSLLGEETARFERDAADLDERLEGPTIAAWTDFRSLPDVALFDRAVEAVLARADGEPERDDAPDVTRTFEAAYVRSEALIAVVDSAVEDITAGAERVEVSARADATRMRWLLVLLVGGTLVAALASARSIARSLRRLDEQAHHVSSGALDTPLVDERGPREIAAVARALNDLVVDLRVVERQAKALAAGHLDDPALEETMPGGLGEALHEAVGLLSASIVEREALQQRLAHEATHDALTGLANRPAALETIERAIARARRRGELVGILFCDLDGFKDVNDNHGHAIGDAVLREVARRLTDHVRDGDVVARLGGDEFVVVAEPVQSVAEAVGLAQRLVDAVSQPFKTGGVETAVGMSIGVSVSAGPEATPDGLLAASDTAVYAAKARGKGRVEVAADPGGLLRVIRPA